MNIRQVRYFVSTVECGSLSAAAKQHYVTVQALSKSLSDLEKELGESLFIRKSHGVSPTLFGEAFYRKSKATLKEFEKLEAFKQSEHREDEVTLNSETLRLAMVAPPFYRFSSACDKMASFAKRTMGIDANVSITRAGEGLDALRTGKLDALLTLGRLAHEDVNCITVGTAPLGVLMAPNHPLASAKDVHLDDLRRFPLLTSEGFDLINDNLVPYYKARGLDVSRKKPSLMEILRFVFKENGLVFAVGIPALGGMLAGTKLKLVATEDAYPIPTCLISLKGCTTPAYFAFEHCLINKAMLLMREDIPQ